MCEFMMSNGKQCSAKLNTEGKCRYTKHNINKVVVSENVHQNIPKAEEQITETDMSPNSAQAIIAMERQNKEEASDKTDAITKDASADSKSLYNGEDIESETKLNNSLVQKLRAQVESDMQKEKKATLEQQQVKYKIEQPKIERENIETKSRKTNILQIIAENQYDVRLYSLCCMLHKAWFNDSNNLWNLAGYFSRIPHVDRTLMRNTYLAILHEKTERFSLPKAMEDWKRWRDCKYFPKLNENSIKSIVGGISTDAYHAWKTEYEPEPIKESKKVKKNDYDEMEKIPLVDEFKNLIIQCADGKYKREYGSGVIYEKQTSYYYTRKYEDPMQFLNKILSNDSRYRTLKPNDCNNLLNFIKVIECPGFDFIKLDYSYIGFKNGIYDLDTAEFVLEQNIVGNIQVRRYINMDFIIGETPNLDKYMKYQFDDEEIEFNYFMLGRLLTKLKDNFDFMVLLYGQGGSGKSLTLKLIRHGFAPDQVGIFSNSFQDRFGASELAGCQITLSDDMPANIAKTLPKSDFLSMMSRGPVSCPVKGKSSIMVSEWLIPTLINSNFLPNYTDMAGEITRRIWLMNFKNNISDDEKDTDLESKILESEYPTFLHRCRSTYLKYCKLYKGKSVESFCPQSALENRSLLREASNNSYQFIKECFTFDENSSMEVKDIRNEFKQYMKERYDMKRAPKDTLNVPTISQVDIKYEYKKQMFCKSCSKLHKSDCCKDYHRENRTSKEIVYGLKKIPRELEMFHARFH